MDDPEYILLEPFSEGKTKDVPKDSVDLAESSPKFKTHITNSHKHILVTVIVKQALINASKISPGIEYDAVSLKTVPNVIWEQEFTEKKFHTNEMGEEMSTSFGIANVQTKFSCSDMEVEELLSSPSLPLKIKLHFNITVEEGVHRKAHATASVDIVNWIKEISPIIRKARKKDKFKPIHKYKSFELVMDGEVSDESKSEKIPEIGKLFCLIQVGTHRGTMVSKNNELIYLLSVENGEKIAQHIYDYCLPQEFNMTDNARHTLLEAIEVPSKKGKIPPPTIEPLPTIKQTEDSAEVSLEEDPHLEEPVLEHIKRKKDGISPNSFYILTDLLCIKDFNPILYACKAIGLAGEYEEFYDNISDTQKRQWGDVKAKCEKRAMTLLDVASQIYPGEYGKIGITWKSQLLQDVPDAVLNVNSPSVASHGLIVDVLRERWQSSYTNQCCGVTGCLPRRHPSFLGQLKIFNTPKATFYWNLIVYLLFLSLATYSIVRIDRDIYEFHNTLNNQLVDVDGSLNFQYISNNDDFWSWANVVLGDKIFTSTNNSLLPTLVGNMTLRQFRVVGTSCPGLPYTLCYEDLRKDQSNWQIGGSWKGTPWDSVAGHSMYGPFFGALPTGGYTADISPDQNAVQSTINTLQNDSWIDVATRTIAVEFVMYSTFHHFYGLVAMFVEWTSVGAVKPSHFLYIIPISSLQFDQTTMLIQIAILIITFGYIAQEVYEFLTSNEDVTDYLCDVWNWFDLCVFVFYFIIVCLQFHFPFAPNFNPLEQNFSTLFSYWRFHFVQSSLEAFMVMLLWFRVCYFFRVTQYTGSLLIIIGKLFQDMLYFTALVFLVIAGASVFMDALLRDGVSIYRDWGTTIITLSYAALGHGEFLASEEDGISITQTFGNVVFLIFLMFVTILLINLLIALMNNTYSTWSEYATGLWVLQFTELLHRYEAHAWPPPLNLLGFPFYASMLFCCKNKLYSYRFKHKRKYRAIKAFQKRMNIRKINFEAMVKNKEREISKHTAQRGLKEWHIHPVTHTQNPTEINNESSDKKPLDFLITNHIEDPVSIYLLHNHVRHKYLTILPGTNAWIDKAFDGQNWVACRDALKESDKVAVLDRENNDIQSMKYKQVMGLNLKIKPILKCGEVHSSKHPLIFVSVSELENELFVCESCGSHIHEAGIFCIHAVCNIWKRIDSKDKSRKGEDLFVVCLGCYYRASLDEYDKKVQEQLSRFFIGERWWIKHHSKQYREMKVSNELVTDLVLKYIELTNKQEPKSDDE